MKKWTALLLALVLIASVAVLPVSAAGVSVTLNGTALSENALIEDGNVFLPLRSAVEALGDQAVYARKDGVQTVTVSTNGGDVVLNLTDQRITDRGHEYYASVPSSPAAAIQLMDGKTTYLESSLFGQLFSVSTTYDANAKQVTVQSVPQNEIVVTDEKTEKQDGLLKLSLQIPQISGLADSRVQNSINQVFQKAADDAKADGEKNAADLKQSIADGYGGSGQCETDLNYRISYNRNGLLSVVLLSYAYAGGAHGSSIQSSYTFNLTTGKDLPLSDLMVSGSGYAAYINKQIRGEIDRRVATGGLYEFDTGKFTDIGTDPSYYLSDSGVVFYFQEYEYFPYAAGIQEFTIPYADLKTMLRPEFRFLYTAPVTLSDSGTTKLAAGTTGRIQLPGNATTGYAWKCESSDSSVLAMVGSAYLPSASNGMVGVGGTYLFDFKALKAGTATVTCRYYREWEGSQAALRTVTYHVTVS